MSVSVQTGTAVADGAAETALARKAAIGRRRRAAVAASVIRDHPVSGALQRPRTHHHVAARGRQAVQEHDRRPLARLGYRQLYAGALDQMLDVQRT